MDFCAEEEFLKKYDDSKYEKPSVTADIAIFSVFDKEVDNYRKLPERVLKVLLIKRGTYPYKDMYALPGGFVHQGETVDDAAQRELREETGIDCCFLEQVRTFSDPMRDPRRWVITSAYLALLDGSKYKIQAGDDASDAEWFQVSMKQTEEKQWRLKLTGERDDICVDLGEREKPIFSVSPELYIIESQNIAFDHGLILAHTLLNLRKWIKETDIAFSLLPDQFTLTQLQQIHEAVLEKRLLSAAFRRKVEPYLEATDYMTSDEGHRPSRLYRKKKVN
jgi:ADP-ribose pyrophosphatase YjhB (NUDIX family)